MRKLALGFVLLLAAASCSAGGPLSATGHAADSLKLTVLPDSFVPGGSGSFHLEVHPDAGGLRADVVADNASGLKALYFELAYDPRALNPTAAEATGALAPDGRPSSLLALAVLREPGKVTHGQIIPHFQTQQGYNGSGVLASVKFESGPMLANKVASDFRIDFRAHVSFDSGTNTLSWRYAPRGDYDQNSMDNIADLTPLGAHFMEHGPFTYTSSLSIIDGDSNGEINIADLTPLGQFFGQQLTGYNVYRSTVFADFPNPDPTAANGPTTELLGSIGTLGSTFIPGERRSFSFLVPAPGASDLFWVRPVGPVDIASYPAWAGGSNIPPTAHLSSDVTSGAVPLLVNFDAGGSYDLDGTITDYQWDWDGDGTYDFDGGTAPTVPHTYSSDGTFNATVLVTDNLGATSTAFVTIVAGTGQSWHIRTLTGADELGKSNSVADVGGVPAVAFVNDTDHNLYFWLASDPLGQGWNGYVQADSSGLVNTPPVGGMNVCLLDVAGAPAIAYYRNGSIYYVRASDAAGTIWGTPVPTALYAGAHPSLAIVNGNPAISYVGTAANDLEYIRADSGDGTSWLDPPVVVDNSVTSIGQNNSLAVIAGKPAIGYTDDVNFTVWYAWSSDASGASGTWSKVQTSTDTPAGGDYTSLAEVDGLPAIAYPFQGTGTFLHYVRATDSSYLNWSIPIDPTADDTFADHGLCPSMAVYNGKPAIAFWRNGACSLRFVTASDADGAAWDPAQEADPQALPLCPGQNAHLAIVGGHPVISEYEETNGDLRIAILY